MDAVEALRLAVWFRAAILCEGLSKGDCPGENKEKKAESGLIFQGSL